jgi:hypothetical protein
MMQGKPIDVAPVVAAARQAFCAVLRTYTGAPGDDGCANRNFCKYATHMVQGGTSAEHDELPIPAYVAALAPLAKKRALARMRLSGAPIQSDQPAARCWRGAFLAAALPSWLRSGGGHRAARAVRVPCH